MKLPSLYKIMEEKYLLLDKFNITLPFVELIGIHFLPTRLLVKKFEHLLKLIKNNDVIRAILLEKKYSLLSEDMYNDIRSYAKINRIINYKIGLEKPIYEQFIFLHKKGVIEPSVNNVLDAIYNLDWRSFKHMLDVNCSSLNYYHRRGVPNITYLKVNLLEKLIRNKKVGGLNELKQMISAFNIPSDKIAAILWQNTEELDPLIKEWLKIEYEWFDW